MNGQLIVLACAVFGALAWAPREEEARPEVVYTAPQVVAAPQYLAAPAPVLTQVVAPQPYAAHRHRFSGSLLLAKAKAVLNSEDASGYAYPAVAPVAVRPPVYSAPERFYHGARYLAGRGPAPVFAAPHAVYPHEGGYLRYRLYNDQFKHADEDYHHSRVEQEERERRQILALRAAEDDKRHHFEDYLRHESDEALERSKFREFGRFARLNNYVHQQEAQAEFGALIGQLQHKRREHVFGLVFQVIKFCKCRDDIVDLHRYFSGADKSNSSYGSYGNDQKNVDDQSQLFGQGGVIPIPRSPEQAQRWFMRGLVNTICDSSKFYVEKVKKLAAQQGFAGTFESQYNQMQNGQFDNNNNYNNNNVQTNDNNNVNNQNNIPTNDNNNFNNQNQFGRNNNVDNYNTNYNANTNDNNRSNNNNYYNNKSQ